MKIPLLKYFSLHSSKSSSSASGHWGWPSHRKLGWMHFCDLVYRKYSVLLHAVQFGSGWSHDAVQWCGSSSLAWSETVCSQSEGVGRSKIDWQMEDMEAIWSLGRLAIWSLDRLEVIWANKDPDDEQNVFWCSLRKNLRSGHGMSTSKVWSDLSSQVSCNAKLPGSPFKTLYQG